jgi:hypothetical protein
MSFIETLFRSLQRETNDQIQELRQEMNSRFADVSARLERMDVRLTRMDRTLSAGIRQLANLSIWAEKQDQFQADTVSRLIDLEERVQKLERKNGTQ